MQVCALLSAVLVLFSPFSFYVDIYPRGQSDARKVIDCIEDVCGYYAFP